MSLQAVTLHLPELVYQRAKHAADVLQRPVEDLIVDTLASTLPVLDDVPAEMVSEIAAMSHLSDEALQGLATSTRVPSGKLCSASYWISKAVTSWMRRSSGSWRYLWQNMAA